MVFKRQIIAIIFKRWVNLVKLQILTSKTYNKEGCVWLTFHWPYIVINQLREKLIEAKRGLHVNNN